MGINEYISNQFSKPSGFGGIISTFIMNKMNRKQYDTVIKNINIENGNKVLDIGFGNGKLISKLSLNSNGQFYGIDVSEDMIRNGKQKYPKLDLRIANILESPFENDFFNYIYTVNTIYFWEDINKGLNEVKRNLTNDGVFINVFYTKEWLEGIKYTNYGFNRYTLDEIRNKSKEAGFDILEVIEISKNKSYCIIASKVEKDYV